MKFKFGLVFVAQVKFCCLGVELVGVKLVVLSWMGVELDGC